jgi:hypothetical protein
MNSQDKVGLAIFLIALIAVAVCIGVSITSVQNDKKRCADLGGIYGDGKCFKKEILYF